jgi:hypothetical protein
MARSKKKSALGRATDADAGPGESRAAEALTSIWMLSAVNTFVAQAVWIGLRFYIRANAVAQPVALLAGLLLLIAAVLSLVVLVLTPIVYRVRRVRPPAVVTLLAVVIALGPWAALAVLAWGD